MISTKTTILAALAAMFAVAVRAETGTALFFSPGGALGACGNPIQDSDFAVALSPSEYGDGSNCGRKMNVQYQGKSVDVTVQDKCVVCQTGQIDLTEVAFEQLASIDTPRLDGVNYNFE